MTDQTTPTPPRPTMADMPYEERAKCQWMQAEIIDCDEPLVIARIKPIDGSPVILYRDGLSIGVPADYVTPRPDLPRLEWPGDKNPDPAHEGEPRND